MQPIIWKWYYQTLWLRGNTSKGDSRCQFRDRKETLWNSTRFGYDIASTARMNNEFCIWFFTLWCSKIWLWWKKEIFMTFIDKSTLGGENVSHASVTLLRAPCRTQTGQVCSPKSHGSPVIVHGICQSSPRVSFDLTFDNKTPDECDKPNLTTIKAFVNEEEISFRERRGSGSLSDTSR
jgi:hypothetical protein